MKSASPATGRKRAHVTVVGSLNLDSIATVQRLPRPGETLHVRVAGAESKLWRVLAETSGLPFACTVIEDDEVVPGSAFVEFQNARLDIGPAAQRALVRAALGLPMPSATGE